MEIKKYFYILTATILLTFPSCNSEGGDQDASGEKAQQMEKKEPLPSKSIGGFNITTENYSGLNYRNGDPIPVAQSAEEWGSYSDKMQGCAAYVNFDKKSPYGIIYNGFAITDKRGFAPKGYHVPTNKEWKTLWESIGDGKTALKPMQSKEYWAEPGTNASGFNAIPAGYFAGKWYGVGNATNFWSSTPTNPEIDEIYLYHFDIFHHSISTWYDHSSQGMSVRLIKD